MLDTDKRCIEEALFAIDSIAEYVKGVPTKEVLISDKRNYDAVLMNFIVLGQCCNRLSDELKKNNAHIDWRGANDFRNFIAHDYFGVSEDVVWSVIQFHLPQLRKDLQQLIKE